MIQTFHDADTRAVFETGTSLRWKQINKAASRKLQMLESASTLHDLKAPPNNQLEALKRERKGQHSIRINKQFRLCFIWKTDGAYGVEITDYH